MAQIINATDSTFEAEVIQSDIPVLVDFWAPWCGPCKTIGPALVALAEELDGKVKIVKVDVDENFEVASKYHIRNIPTMLVFDGGVQKAMRAGAATKSVIGQFISKSLS